MPITLVELITISIVTVRSIFGTTLRPIFCVLENFRRKFANLVASPTDGSTKRLVRCKIHPVLHNWRRYPSSKCYESDENLRFGICRSAVAPSDSAEKMAIWMHNYSPSGAQMPQRYLGKFTSCMTFGAHKFVRSEPDLDYLYEL